MRKYRNSNLDYALQKITYFTHVTGKAMEPGLPFIEEFVTRSAPFSCYQHLKMQPKPLAG